MKHFPTFCSAALVLAAAVPPTPSKTSARTRSDELATLPWQKSCPGPNGVVTLMDGLFFQRAAQTIRQTTLVLNPPFS